MLRQLTAHQLGAEPWLTTDVATVTEMARGTLAMLAVVLLPVLGMIVLSAVVGNVIQFGLLFLPEQVVPDFSRVDPAQGLSRLLSWRSAARFLFGLVKLSAVALVAWFSFESDRDRIMNCGQLPVAALAVFVAETLLWTAVRIVVTLLAVAVLDYGYERWRYERELRMTDQELREELRSLNGDPRLSAQRRGLRKSLANRPFASRIGQTSLLIVDPRGLAVAVQYDPRARSAPLVAAKGIGKSGLDMIATAVKHRVPTVEQPALAKSLYEAASVDQPIPARLYTAVAEVLAAVPSKAGSGVEPAGRIA